MLREQSAKRGIHDGPIHPAGEGQSFPRIDSFKGSYTYSNSGETWVEVGRERVYTPAADDVGAILKFECTAYDAGG